MAVASTASAPVVARAATATGLTPSEISGLRRSEKILLAGWHETKSGDDNGRPWLPRAIRRLQLEARLALASDEKLELAWLERERRRVQDVVYFTANYGHVKHGSDDEPGPPIPFDLWAPQLNVLRLFEIELRIAVLKARQLGLTWLALHYGYHLMAIDPDGASSVVLGLSQDGGYAKRLLERARAINDLLPPFLRQREDRETRGSKTEFKLAGRGRMVSLPGTPSAPRSWQADLAICDEWAFVRNAQAGPTMRALLPAARQIIAISSGNGPPDEEGWGQHFAQLYVRGREGTNDFVPVFLPDSTHPARTPEAREAERENFDTEEEYLAEHPETDDDALIGAGKDRYFKLADINAAVKLGGELDRLLDTDDMPPPSGEELHGGLDWGEHSFGVVIWPLEGGGVYVPPCELPSEKTEPSETCDAFHQLAAELQEVDPDTGRLMPPLGEARYDAAGIQSQRTFMARARARYAHQYTFNEVRSRKVPFGKYKSETSTYLRRLFRRVGQARATGVIAISPKNTELIRQLRSLESARDGWKKADDQHGPDALVAAVQRIARVHREMRGD